MTRSILQRASRSNLVNVPARRPRENRVIGTSRQWQRRCAGRPPDANLRNRPQSPFAPSQTQAPDRRVRARGGSRFHSSAVDRESECTRRARSPGRSTRTQGACSHLARPGWRSPGLPPLPRNGPRREDERARVGKSNWPVTCCRRGGHRRDFERDHAFRHSDHRQRPRPGPGRVPRRCLPRPCSA